MTLVKISPETFNTIYRKDDNGNILRNENGDELFSSRIIPENFKPYRLYDLENQLNENKREILLVDREYAEQIVKEFKRLISDDNV